MTGDMLDNGTLLTAINDPAASARVATNRLTLFDTWTRSEVDSMKQSSAELHVINPTWENTFQVGYMSDIGERGARVSKSVKHTMIDSLASLDGNPRKSLLPFAVDLVVGHTKKDGSRNGNCQVHGYAFSFT